MQRRPHRDSGRHHPDSTDALFDPARLDQVCASACNPGNFLWRLVFPRGVPQLSLTTLQKTLIRIGALQRILESINERLHLRLRMTPMKYHGQPVWFGQAGRDIGVRLTWNLTTHRIDPDVDEARDSVVEEVTPIGRLALAACVSGASEGDRAHPGRNGTGAPCCTDGKRAVVLRSPTFATPRFVAVE